MNSHSPFPFPASIARGSGSSPRVEGCCRRRTGVEPVHDLEVGQLGRIGSGGLERLAAAALGAGSESRTCPSNVFAFFPLIL